ncbi:type I glyceraldehyde-3-phosphate dehydrogenase [Pedobacter sp. ASV28]|uniref:type I glyceraldehyde-3-phosphate dehydrogenase n=1 Tax=Pedobacter sp. ASV28 TaxID=2795123 RepID=UPI0018EBFD2C|nr:type I glyceraldehyde-3-phosphate dehydrogenase [Pedobacter sp. ASV28]
MNLAINGFGRIGRMFLRTALQRNLRVVAINDLATPATLAHLFKYDSVHGVYPGTVFCENDKLVIDGLEIQVLANPNPAELPWKALGIDLVIEATGKFANKNAAEQHLAAGARQVLISAPALDKDIPMVVMGVNDHLVDFKAPILSNASCTTNNVAPMVKILDDHWGIKDGYITTVHSMTGDQNLHDSPHQDLRRARAASSSIIPTTTGAAKAITHIFPHLTGKLGGAGIRVPVLNGSLTDFTCILKKKTTIEEINDAFLKASTTHLSKILQFTKDPIVSVDIINNTYSCVFDAQLTSIVGDLVKVVGWYDNETGYSSRLVDVVDKISEHYG